MAAREDQPTYLCVSEVIQLLQFALDQTVPQLTFVAEISDITKAASGHYYLTLKDEKAQGRANQGDADGGERDVGIRRCALPATGEIRQKAKADHNRNAQHTVCAVDEIEQVGHPGDGQQQQQQRGPGTGKPKGYGALQS